MTRPYFDNRLRMAYEFVPAAVLSGIGTVLLCRAQWAFPILPEVAQGFGLLFVGLASVRMAQGVRLLRYRAGLRRLPTFVLDADRMPVSRSKLFLGLGFTWDQRHAQRLVETQSPAALPYLRPNELFRWARRFELRHEADRWAAPLIHLLRVDTPWNLARPDPAIGGNPCLHGVGVEDETEVWQDLGERPGHTLVLGTTRVGKTRLAELLVAQDIRRGETVIVLDPKGDVDLLRRMYAEARRSGRLDQFYIFHLGYPEISARYNPVGEFGRITEVASRIAMQLPSEGNSAAFREFAWRFTNAVSRALVALGRKPDYAGIARYVTHIEPLLVEYHQHWFAREAPADWKVSVETIAANLSDRNLPPALRGRDPRAIALVRFARERGLFDPVADALRSAFEYDKTYFDKLTASLLPLLEKLTSGTGGRLLAPLYADLSDPRPVLDWMRMIRENAIVYVGLDALADREVASAVGNSMFADLTSVAGSLYKFGDARGLPEIEGHVRRPIVVHADEFNEIVGDEFIPLLNKGGGAGLQITAYTQTASDIEAGIGNRAKAGQVTGNLNSLIMLRVKNEETAEFLTKQLPPVRIYRRVAESRVIDDNQPYSATDFISQNADRITDEEAEMLRASDLIELPKGQAFALLDGGQLYKLRLPLPGADPLLPGGVEEIIAWSTRRYGLAHG
ncbi:MAG: type IV conjugative transfer system coupling protein TraD [Pseudomonadota bacterium]|nr:type IV conjugative transfer system coupling protein TraD [Nevskiales bacterium]MEC9364759.1 type IV conjugative transfer system coupling protein TraD [Pseudomonadota bacterium]